MKCLMFSHTGQEEGGKMALKPPRMNAGEGSEGTESVFLSYFIVFFSPRRQPVDLPVLQAFFPSNTDKARVDEDTRDCYLCKLTLVETLQTMEGTV